MNMGSLLHDIKQGFTVVGSFYTVLVIQEKRGALKIKNRKICVNFRKRKRLKKEHILEEPVSQKRDNFRNMFGKASDDFDFRNV